MSSQQKVLGHYYMVYWRKHVELVSVFTQDSLCYFQKYLKWWTCWFKSEKVRLWRLRCYLWKSAIKCCICTINWYLKCWRHRRSLMYREETWYLWEIRHRYKIWWEIVFENMGMGVGGLSQRHLWGIKIGFRRFTGQNVSFNAIKAGLQMFSSRSG